MEEQKGKHQKLFYLALFTTFVTFLLIGLGNVVTRTQSGLGCGDHWPTCNGVWIPDLTNIHVVIEFFHRVLAAVVGFLALFLTVACWRVTPGPFTRSIRNLSLLSLLVLAAQVVIGGITVRMKLPPAVVILHNGVSIAFFGTLMFLTVRILQLNGWVGVPGRVTGEENTTSARSSLVPFLIFLSGLLFAQILLGAYVRQSGSRTGCTGMIPFCQNNAILPPATPEAMIHFTHRTLGLIVALALVYLLIRVLVSSLRPLLRYLAIIECFLVGLQVISGMMSVWTEDRLLVIWSTVHLMNAALLLGIIVFMLVCIKPLPSSRAESEGTFAVEQ